MTKQQTSVVIPVRDGEAYVADAARSVLVQLAADDELIIVDDASLDGTRDCVMRIEDSRLRIIDGAGRGVSAARNLGAAAARGEFLAFLDHDDLWPEGRHAAALATLVAEPDLAACLGRTRVRYDAGAKNLQASKDLDGAHCATLIGSWLFRRRALLAVGAFAEDLLIGEDVDFSFRVAASGLRTGTMNADSLIYRRHGTNMTNDTAAVAKSLLDIARRRRALAR